MEHEHNLIDKDTHFVIDPETMVISSTSLVKSLRRGDHRAEKYSFSMPRYIEGHDTLLCNKVEVHYNNIKYDSTTNKTVTNKSFDKVKDLRVSADSEDTVVWTWIVSGDATQLDGTLNFCIRFACMTGDKLDYQKFTEIYEGIPVGNVIYNTEELAKVYADALEKWRQDIYFEFYSHSEEDLHAKFFNITDDGILSLKPEYRGACPSNRNTYTYAISDNGLDAIGSKNADLPKNLAIPVVVNEIAVTCLADGMFMYNEAVETLVLPEFTTEIPERFCDNAHRLEKICNTEYISTIEWAAFQYTHLDKAKFPNLKSMSDYALNACGFLVYADIGNVTDIPSNCFSGCMMLSRIKGGANVTKVGKNAFNLCYRLNSVEFLPNLTSIGDNAFLRCRLRYDWASLQNCTFGNKATALQINPTDIWSGCNVTAKENAVPTLLSQKDPRWKDKRIGTTDTPYAEACVLFTVMHIYCALHGLKLNTIEEFEQIANGIDPSILNDFSASLDYAKTMCEKMGMKVEYYTEYTQSSLQAVYDALAEGKYAIAMFSARHGTTQGHAAMIYGVKENKEWLIADSALTSADTIGEGERTIKYPMSYQNATEPSLDVYIVSL